MAIVDDEDYPSLAKNKWWVRRDRDRLYAVRGVHPPILMHREIIHAEGVEQVDHINRDGLDNRRGNLRLASYGQNQANCKRHASNTSGFKGVSRDRRRTRKAWRAYLTVGGRHRFLGSFDDPAQAAKAYDQAALIHFGEFARTNAEMGLLI